MSMLHPQKVKWQVSFPSGYWGTGRRGKREVWHKSNCIHEGIFTVHRGKQYVAWNYTVPGWQKLLVWMLYICQDREDWTCPYIWDLAAIMGKFLQVESMSAWSVDHLLCHSSTDVSTDSQLQHIQCCSNTHLEPCCVWKGWFITPSIGWPEILSKTPIKPVTHCSPLWYMSPTDNFTSSPLMYSAVESEQQTSRHFKLYNCQLFVRRQCSAYVEVLNTGQEEEED
jgi:hypothetical protein